MTIAISGRQIKAARALLGWTAQDLADRAGLHRNSVTLNEADEMLPLGCYASGRIIDALEEAGVQLSREAGELRISYWPDLRY